ncbi:hypothetical protein O1L44_13750 [Streptomyces noursei]|nr:hypothetical protein [Streptomyces noursei]
MRGAVGTLVRAVLLCGCRDRGRVGVRTVGVVPVGVRSVAVLPVGGGGLVLRLPVRVVAVGLLCVLRLLGMPVLRGRLGRLLRLLLHIGVVGLLPVRGAVGRLRVVPGVRGRGSVAGGVAVRRRRGVVAG